MNLQTIFTTLSVAIGIGSFVPYIRDIFRLKNTPHSYSWLVWTILQVTGALAMLASGAGLAGASYLLIGALLCVSVFLLSLRYGTKDITTFDTVCLIGALVATSVWFFLHDALLSIILVSLIDWIAFMPTFRKAYEEPLTETLSMYALSGVAQLLSLASLAEYHFTTTLYLITLASANAVFVVMVLIRRRRTRMEGGISGTSLRP